mmetsp:Transcript_184302/g.584468  ORF Transcript_184302/g.584468 Transcript_184302/m.584468 type:complete len:1189 (+) Transcript_184302:96-3662(+)
MSAIPNNMAYHESGQDYAGGRQMNRPQGQIAPWDEVAWHADGHFAQQDHWHPGPAFSHPGSAFSHQSGRSAGADYQGFGGGGHAAHFSMNGHDSTGGGVPFGHSSYGGRQPGPGGGRGAAIGKGAFGNRPESGSGYYPRGVGRGFGGACSFGGGRGVAGGGGRGGRGGGAVGGGGSCGGAAVSAYVAAADNDAGSSGSGGRHAGRDMEANADTLASMWRKQAKKKNAIPKGPLGMPPMTSLAGGGSTTFGSTAAPFGATGGARVVNTGPSASGEVGFDSGRGGLGGVGGIDGGVIGGRGTTRRAGMKKKEKPSAHNKVINRQVTMIAELGDMAQLLDIIQVYMPDMNGLNLTTAFHRIAKLSANDSDQKVTQLKNHGTFKALYREVWNHVSHHSLSDGDTAKGGGKKSAAQEGSEEQGLDPATILKLKSERPEGWEMPVPCMSIVTWSCATMRIRDQRLFDAIAEIVSARLDALKSFELSNLLWAYAKVALVPPNLFESARQRIATRAPNEFKGQCLSTIAWAFATAERRDPVVFEILAAELKATASELKTQEISNTLWAFAKSRAVDSELFEMLGNVAVEEPRIWMFKSQELSNTVWAFATLCFHHTLLFSKVEKAAVVKRQEMVPQNIANILWAYAKLQVPTSHMFWALLQVACSQLSQYKRQELSTVIWSASQVCPQQAEFFGMAARLCCHRLKEFSPNAIANLTRDLSCVEMNEPWFFITIMKEGTRRLPHFDPGALCILLRGALKASKNPSLSSCWDDISEALGLISENLAPRAARLRTLELQDTSEALFAQHWPDGQPYPAAVVLLEQGVSMEMARRREAKDKDPRRGGADPESSEEEEEEKPERWQERGRKVVDCDDAGSNGGGSEAGRAKKESLSRRGVGGGGGCRIRAAWGGCGGGGCGGGKGFRGVSDGMQDVWSGGGGAQGFVETPAPWPLGGGSGGCWWGYGSQLGEEQGEMGYGGGSCAAAAGCCAGTTCADEQGWPADAMWEQGQKAILVQAPSSSSRPLLRTFDASCLTELSPEGVLGMLDLGARSSEKLVGTGNHVVSLRHGLLDVRIVLKRLPTNLTAVPAPEEAEHNHILEPFGAIGPIDDAAVWGGAAGATKYVAYLHCRHGSLPEWMAARCAEGRPLSVCEEARVAQQILLAAEAALPSCPEAAPCCGPTPSQVRSAQRPPKGQQLRG